MCTPRSHSILRSPPEQSQPFLSGPQEDMCVLTAHLGVSPPWLGWPGPPSSVPVWLQPALFSPSLRKNPVERMSYLELMVSAGRRPRGGALRGGPPCAQSPQRLWLASVLNQSATQLCLRVCSDIPPLPPQPPHQAPWRGSSSALTAGAEGWGGRW